LLSSDRSDADVLQPRDRLLPARGTRVRVRLAVVLELD